MNRYIPALILALVVAATALVLEAQQLQCNATVRTELQKIAVAVNSALAACPAPSAPNVLSVVASVNKGNKPLPVAFTASYAGEADSITWLLDTINDGEPARELTTQPASDPTFSYTFSSAGTFRMHAQVWNASGSDITTDAEAATIEVSDAPIPPSDLSHAMGLWEPNPTYDTCTKAEHDSYYKVGPDGKRYPTWHPPIHTRGDGTTCTFGHEHGRNPNEAGGSALLSSIEQQYGGILFGYVNEQLDVWNHAHGSSSMRHEDHVGHKIEWGNHVRMAESVNVGAEPRRYVDVYCDFLMKMHQGTHSKDAFTNNLHEVVYAVQCDDGPGGSVGTRAIIAKMIAFGQPGGFSEGATSGGFTFISVGPASPADSPTGPGVRSLPTINRVLEHVLVPSGQWSHFSEGVYEDWISANYLTKPDGAELAYFDPHFAVFGPSRFYWPGNDPNTYGITRSAEDRANNVGRSIDVCWMHDGEKRARGGDCDILTDYGEITTPFHYQDPRGTFNGIHREMYFNNTSLQNLGGATVWYTDPFGGGAVLEPFVGAIKHYISAVDNRRRAENGRIDTNGRLYAFESNAIGSDRDYRGNGVHSPN